MTDSTPPAGPDDQVHDHPARPAVDAERAEEGARREGDAEDTPAPEVPDIYKQTTA